MTLHPLLPMEVREGILAAAVRDVQSMYMLEQPLSPMVVRRGMGAADVREVSPEYMPVQPPLQFTAEPDPSIMQARRTGT